MAYEDPVLALECSVTYEIPVLAWEIPASLDPTPLLSSEPMVVSSPARRH